MVLGNPPSQRSWVERLWDVGCIASILGIWPRYIEPHLLLTSRYRVTLPSLPPSMDGLRLVHFSDLHINDQSSSSFLHRVAHTIMDLSPDLILFSGDLLSYSQLPRPDLAASFFANLSAPLGVYACLGNHDYACYATFETSGRAVLSPTIPNPIIQGIKQIFSCGNTHSRTPVTSPLAVNDVLTSFYRSAGVTLVHNETVHIGKGKTHINLTGFGDLAAGDCFPSQAYQGRDPHVPTIVLAHNPDTYHSYLPGDLFLFGHTHGGQVNIPFLWQRITPVRDKSLKSGLVLRDDRTLFISRGVGASFPFRLFAPPELTLFELVREGPITQEARATAAYGNRDTSVSLATPRNT